MDDIGSEIYEVSNYLPDMHEIPPLQDIDKVTLTSCQQYWARVLTKWRERNNAKVGTRATLYTKDGRTISANNINSWGGEMGCAVKLNVFPSLEFDKFERHDIWYPHKPFKTEVKTGDRRGTWLGVKALDHIFTDPPTYYVLMEGEFPTYWFIGFIRSTDLLIQEHYRTCGPSGKLLDHPMYTAEQWELSKTIY